MFCVREDFGTPRAVVGRLRMLAGILIPLQKKCNIIVLRCDSIINESIWIVATCSKLREQNMAPVRSKEAL